MQKGDLLFTPRVKKVLQLASVEARSLNYNYIGTEHILLGLLKEGEGVAAQILACLEIDAETVRTEVLKALDPNFIPSEAGEQTEQPGAATQGDEKMPALKAFRIRAGKACVRYLKARRWHGVKPSALRAKLDVWLSTKMAANISSTTAQAKRSSYWISTRIHLK